VSRPWLSGVPKGYAVHRVAATWLVLDTQLSRDLVGLRLADPDVRERLFARAEQRGRGRTPTVQLAHGCSLVLRRYRHGGLLRWLTGSLLWGPTRALWELEVTARAERSLAPVPHVACVVAWPAAGPLWSALIGTVEIEDGEELLGWMRRTRAPADRVAIARRVGEAIRRLHDAGIEHRDLQLRNILVRATPERPADDPQIVVIDLDGASYHGSRGVPIARRAQNLGRLARSVIKLGLWGESIGPRERAAFLSGYLRRDRELRRALRDFVPRERIKLRWHQLGYRLRSAPARPAVAPPRPA
jgi:tRNA A-37 threonylcarbamoyl transferase component Bud32